MLALADDAPPGPGLETGSLLDGRYQILAVLAAGGMSTVFLAEHRLIKRRVAVKVLHAELAGDRTMVQRFMNEATAAGRLGHPNIVESTDMGFAPGNIPFIVFELLEGPLLTEEIYRAGGLPVARAVRIASQVASALLAAHRANIIHLDLKSDNVMLVTRDGVADHVKVLDFGISKFIEADVDKTQRGIVMGTPPFMAPEQAAAPEAVDHRTDIYALGVLLYEMLTARRPFADLDPRIMLDRLVNEPVPPLGAAHVPQALEELILHRMLAKDPALRLQSMAEVLLALAGFVEAERAPELAAGSAPLPAAPALAEAYDAGYESLSIAPVSGRRPVRIGWLYAALGAAAVAGGLAFARLRVADATSAAELGAVRADASKIAAVLAADAGVTRAQAMGIATAPVMRAAVETDPATLADLLADGQLPITAAPGQVIEIVQQRGAVRTTLLHLPASAHHVPLAFSDATRITSDGASLAAVAELPIESAGAPGARPRGSIAIESAVDLEFIRRLVAEDAVAAELVGLGAPLPLVGHMADATGTELAVPLALAPGLARDGVELHAIVRPVTSGRARGHARDASIGAAGLFLLALGASDVRRRRRDPVPGA